MNLKLEIEFSKADTLHEVDARKRQIDDMRPLPEDVEGRVMQKLKLDWNYNSNAIEGNKLSYGETVAFLMTGITAKGKPLKDHLDIRGHNDAINFLLSLVKEARQISESDIRALHEMILVEPYDVKAQTSDGTLTTKRVKLGEYKKLANHVQTVTGEVHYYATPEETPAKMNELMNWYSLASSNVDIHPVVVAALFHHKFVEIHPFDDGNGRLSRILMNLILMRNNYPPVIIKKDDKQNYYSLLSQADSNNSFPFVEYIAERLINSMRLYLKAVNGEDIDEDEDIDKEIELLKMQLNGGMVAKERKSKDSVVRVFVDNILPMSIKLEKKLAIFQEYFFINQQKFNFTYQENRVKQGKNMLVNIEQLENYKLVLHNNALKNLYVQLSLEFKDYKDPENSFNLNVDLNFSFDEFYYRIASNNEVIISKLYHEDITPIDQTKIIRNVIQDFKAQLNQKQKSPKS